MSKARAFELRVSFSANEDSLLCPLSEGNGKDVPEGWERVRIYI